MSVPVRRIAIVAVVVLGLCVGAVAYLGVTVEDGPPDPDALRDSVSEANASLEGYETTIAVTIERGEETTEVEYHLAVDRPNRTNLTYRAPEAVDGDVVIANRTGVYGYDVSRDEWGVYATESRRGYDVLASLVDAVADANASYEGTDRLEGSSGVVLQYSAGGDDVGLRIGGSAPASRFASVDESDRVGLSVWVDPEHELPTRLRQTYRSGGETTNVTLRLTDLEVDPGFGSGEFRYVPPESADRVDRTDLARSYDSRSGLVANVTMSVPDPRVPGNFSLAGAASARLEGNRSVSLVYRDGPTRVTVLKRRPTAPIRRNGTAVDLGAVEGRYVTTPRGAVVAWDCDGATYSVSGTVEREVLVAIARSMACE
jgi:outer membrane lipoprotein-sorting protein